MWFLLTKCSIWLRCSCQISYTDPQKMMLALHWTTNMPREMKWGKNKGYQASSSSGKQSGQRNIKGCLALQNLAVKSGNPWSRTRATLHSSMEHSQGIQSQSPSSWPAIWVSLCCQETILHNFLINMCPCWQTLWMRPFFLLIMAKAWDLITVEMNQERWLGAELFKCRQNNSIHSLLYNFRVIASWGW